MRLLTWNLWWRFGENWQARQPLIDDELRRSDADICAFQEVYHEPGDDQLDRIVEITGLSNVVASSKEGDRARFGNALLSRYPLDDPVEVRLPNRRGDQGHRSALIVDIDTSTGPLSVAATHLEWRYGASRLRQGQLDKIVVELRRRAERGRVPIILGDLNATPDSDELRRLTGHAPAFEPDGTPMVFTDAWAAVGEGTGHTWTRDNPNSVDAAFPRRRLDHVLIGWPRPRPTFNPLSAHLIGTSPGPDGVYPSDHYGVVVSVDDRPPFDANKDEV